MKVTILTDNKDGNGLKGEWGLSFYIEYGSRTVLLDTGLSDLFSRNADLLGLDLQKVDYAVLSHAHDDHANGFDAFFERNDHAPLYIARECYENCYDKVGGRYKYAGIPQGILERRADRIVRADDDEYIDEGIRLLGHTTPGLEKLGLMEQMFLKTGNRKYIPDDFRHEQSLVFELDEGVVIFNSCSHAGADNIISEVMQVYPGQKILAMIGGFHLFNKDEEYIRAFARRVMDTGVQDVYTGHCTGEKGMEILEEELGERFHGFVTGLEFEI